MDEFILIVDDNNENLKVLGNLLTGKGHKIAVAKSGLNAFGILKYDIPMLILLDIMMPEMDGYEVCKKLKANPDTQNIPVIFLTARTDSGDMVKGFQIGGADYVTKPFKPEELIARVNHQIELLRAKTLIHQQAEELESLNRTKDTIFSIISHDMRAPIASILMMVQALNVIDITRQKDFLEEALKLIELSAGETHLLLENLLNWSRSQMKAIKSNPVNFNIIEIIQSVIRLYKSNLLDKELTVAVNTNDKIIVFADQEMMKTVLRNIIHNAMKFSHIDSEIQISVTRQGESVRILIEDKGEGMDSDSVEKIMDRSIYHSSLGTKGEKGTGLGMNICLSLVQMNLGTLKLESEPGNGTKVFLILPSEN